MVKATDARNLPAWKDALEARDEVAKERIVEAYKTKLEKLKVKMYVYQRKKKS